jgi:heme-degrading monooxygenase HmoA
MVSAAFDSMEAVAAWRQHPEHLEAQGKGRRAYYQEYHLQICEVLRESHFDRSDPGA